MHCLRAFHNRIRPPIAGSIITQQCNYILERHRDCLFDSWCKLGSSAHLLSATDFFCGSLWFGKSFCHCSLSINQGKNIARVWVLCICFCMWEKKRARHPILCVFLYLCHLAYCDNDVVCVCVSLPLKLACTMCILSMCASLTWTRGDVTLLILLCWPQAGLSSVLGLWVAAGPLSTADSPAAVSAALGPGTPGRPTAVYCVTWDPSETKHLTYWVKESMDNVKKKRPLAKQLLYLKPVVFLAFLSINTTFPVNPVVSCKKADDTCPPFLASLFTFVLKSKKRGRESITALDNNDCAFTCAAGRL